MQTSPAFAAIAIVTVCSFANAGSAQQLMSTNQTFSFCGSGQRVNCVVDGDTFWLRGTKIRIADIDTPELSPPRCERERQRGIAAKQRLLEILNSGPLTFKSTARDKDRFGRKLRVVYRGIDPSATCSSPKASPANGRDHVAAGVIDAGRRINVMNH